MNLDILFIIIVILTLIGVRFITRQGKYSKLWLICCLINILIVGYFYYSNYRKNRFIKDLESDVYALKEYSTIAQLDAVGNPPGYGPGSDIKFNSELTDLLRYTYTVKDSQYYMNRTPEAESTYKIVIEKYPKFPFGYYFLVLCLREKKDESWKEYAKKGIEILEITTSIDRHNPNHDEILRKLKVYLNEK
jgi:hypothetical protein